MWCSPRSIRWSVVCDTPTFFANSAYERPARAFRMKSANSRSRFRFTRPKWQNSHNVCVMMWCLQNGAPPVPLAFFVSVVMKLKIKRRRCRACGRLFTPDPRNEGRQKYCFVPECRQASKFASQRKWSRKTENLAYSRGAREVRRVQEWRQEHPGYWKKRVHAPNGSCPAEPQAAKPGQESRNACCGGGCTLQDVCLSKNPLFVGLLSVVTGSTLQDDMAATINDLVIRGRKILRLRPSEHDSNIGSDYDRQLLDRAETATKPPQRG
jgi:hypothetical protein